MHSLLRYLRHRGGAAAVEFALVLPGFLFLLIGGANLVMVTYATMTLQSATEAAARYASTWTADNSATTPTTPSSSLVTSFAASQYRGPGIGATFTYATNGACGTTGSNGNHVTGTGTYHVYYGWGSLPFTINAAACFP